MCIRDRPRQWIHRLDILAPLTAVTSKNVRWAWTAEHQAMFVKAKALISREVMLVSQTSLNLLRYTLMLVTYN